MTVGATTTSNQIPVTDHSPVKAAVPLIDQPTPEGTQPPSTADSKFGKTNLNYLKNKLQHTKELLQMVQGGCVNKPFFGRSDLTNLMEKSKEGENVVVSVIKTPDDYHNLSDVFSSASGNPMIMTNPYDKKPKASHLKVAPATISSHSASSTASTKVNYELWQCAHCQSVNAACHISYKYCKLPRG